MGEGGQRIPFWRRPAFSVLLAFLFLLASAWSALSYVFHTWMVAYKPDHPQPHATLSIIYLFATPLFFLAIFIVPFLIRRKARSRPSPGTPAKQ